MAPTPIVLFPHTHVESWALERLIETFGSLTLCQPWFTEPTVLQNDFEKGALKVCFPPEVLKPEENFKGLLSEYQGWMMENRGGKHPATVSTGQGGEETWAIRKSIRDAGKDADDPALRNTLKWHLLLHLAQSLEGERETAQELLKKATAAKSPLAEAMETDEQIPDMFADIPISATYPYVTDRHLNLIFEAWFGLFGNLLETGSELMTLDRQVMTYAFDLFDSCDVLPIGDINPSQAKEMDASGFTVHRKTLPRLSNPSISKNPLTSKDPVLRALSGKALILVEA